MVLIGAQGDESHHGRPSGPTGSGTIGYEIVCGIGPACDRRYVGGAEPLASIGASCCIFVPTRLATHARADRRAWPALARPRRLIVLAGEMGAGKTAFAQGFGRAIGVTEPITSPTYTLVHSYDSPAG